MLRNWFPKPRWKTYAAQSGYVYQYVFEGLNEAGQYIFNAVSGPQVEMLVEVNLSLDQWAQENRPLSEMESFGIAKMALMRALDGEAAPGSRRLQVRPGGQEIAQICRELDL